MPAESLAMPPDPANIETGRETLADTEPLDLEAIEVEKPLDGRTFEQGLDSLKVQVPTDLAQAPVGTATTPAPDTGALTFGPTVGPASATSTTTAAESDGLKQISGLPVLAGPAEGRPAPTGTWQFGVVDRSGETGKGVEEALKVGALVTVQAPATGSVPINVGLKYDKFENLHGADWASRLRLVQFPECYLTTPLEEACQAYEELETANDPVTHTLTAVVDTAADGTVTPASSAGAPQSGPSIMQASYATATPAAAGGDKAVVGAVDSGAGPGGSFKATPLASSGKWGAGGSSGAFTWSYPMTMPAAPAGPAPSITLSYSSQAVDGKTAVSSPQASWIGEGWDYSPGFIERRYRSCKDDTHKLGDELPNNTAKADKTSDLCWVSYNAVMSLGGSTTELVRDAPATSDPESDVEIYRPQRDDGTRIEHRPRKLEGSTANDDDNGEYWTVTTTDGTKYHFGLNKVGGGHGDTNSVSTVPVFGNHPGEPCRAGTFAASRCGDGKQQAWRWGLDKVEDVHGNVMIVNWKQETNHYAVRDKRKTPEKYDRAAYPVSIEYGMRASDLTKPSATVEFGVEQRCLRSVAACAEANFAKTGDPGAYRPWWDTPGSLNCKSTSKLCPGFPSFWTQLRLDTVTTKAARAGQTGLGYVDVYKLHQSFPEDWYDTAPGLWLNSLTRTGYSPGETPEGGGGTRQSEDGVSFAQYQVKPHHPLAYRKAEPGTPREPHLLDKQLPNLVPTGPRDKRPGFTRPRIGIVATEAGGEIEVEYTGGCQTEPTTDAGKANGTCYPVRWSPDGEEKKPAKAWFNKYVVASVTENDKVANLFGASIKTEYTYSGPAWAQSEDEFVRPALRTHSDWRGYRQVTVTKGGTSTKTATAPKSLSVTRYFLGAGGEVKDSIDDTVLLADDAPQYAGMTAETLTYLNSFKKPGEFTARTRTFPDTAFKTAARPRKAEDGTTLPDLVAYRTSVKKTDSIQKIGETSWRGVRSTTLERDPTYNLPTAVETVVVTPKTSGGETLSEPTCTKTAYVHNTTAWLIALPTTVRTTATTCAGHATAKPATELKSSVRTRYDGLAQGATPTKGLVTGVDTIDGTGTAHSVTTTTTHDPLGRVRTVTKPGAGEVEVQYLPGGDKGGPVNSTKTFNAADHATTTTFDAGRALPLTVTDPNGRVTRTEYDDLGRLTKGWSASRSTGTQSPSVEIAYQPATATTKDTRPAAVTVKTLKDDGTYARQVTLYDGLMRQVQTQSEAHGPGRIVTDTHYNDHGLVSEQTGGYLVKDEPTAELFQVKSPSIVPSRVLTTYDGLERPTRQTPYRGRTAQTPTTTTYAADTSVTVDPAGATVPTVTTVTDALGRVTEIKHHTGSGNTRTTSYAYDQRGNRAKVTDPAGNAWTYIHDARGRVTSTTDPDTGTTETTYDSADRPEIVKDTLNQATRTTYDILGRITEVATGKTSFTPVKKFTYDAEGALGLPYESKRITALGDYVARVTNYDAEYRPTRHETVIPENEMTTGLHGTYTYDYTYTHTGMPQSVTLPAKGGLAKEKVITRYNEDGLPESTSGLAWYTSDATYSPYGEVLRAVSSAQPYRVWTTNFIDEHTGRLQRTVTDRETAGPHRLSDTGYSYDASGLMTSSARQTAETPTLTTWDNQCFTYDAMGELVNAWTSSITPDGKGRGCKSASGAAWGYSSVGTPSNGPVADAAHQEGIAPAGLANTAPATGTVAVGSAVTGAAAYHQSFIYDWLGNRTRKTDHDPAGDTSKNTEYAYAYTSAQPHALTSVTSPIAGMSSTYTYHETGTTKTRTILGGTKTQALQWTPEGKLDSNTVGNDKIVYVYDAAGNRILEKTSTGSTLYLGETELTTNGATITRASRSYAHTGAPTVTRTTMNGSIAGHTTSVLIADHLGTANTSVQISTGQAVNRRSFKPYGELRGTKPTAWPNKRSYLGVGIDDTATGLTHIGAREYDQNTGRFLSADPIIDMADPLQMNGYAYSHNSPVSRSDPTGLMDDEAYRLGNSNSPTPNPGWDKPRAARPNVQNKGLQGVLKQIYAKDVAKSVKGDGKLATVVIYELNRGERLEGKGQWHVRKGWETMKALGKVLESDKKAREGLFRRPGENDLHLLSDVERELARAEAVELWNALNADDKTGNVGKVVAADPEMKRVMVGARNDVLKMASLTDITGQLFEKVPHKLDKPTGNPENLRGFGRTFGVAGAGVSVLSYPADVWNYGWEEASKAAVDSLLDPFGMYDDLNSGRGVRCDLWGEGCPAPDIA
ncbi:RHS repeat domain-containing protein [Streptomyces sp. NPDC101490]|uniref:RHS repeat domain-containing protein n=1 Tax=Streptomyces sp. NPDC101490 TaxID=3366143 RepID=UPI0037FD7696